MWILLGCTCWKARFRSTCKRTSGACQKGEFNEALTLCVNTTVTALRKRVDVI